MYCARVWTFRPRLIRSSRSHNTALHCTSSDNRQFQGKLVLQTLHLNNRASCGLYVTKTNKMHALFPSLFQLYYPLHISNKQVQHQEFTSVQAAYGIFHACIWYDMLWYGIVWCDMIHDVIWYDVILCDMICDIIWCDMIYDVIWYDVMLCDIIWCYMIWCDVMWYDVI